MAARKGREESLTSPKKKKRTQEGCSGTTEKKARPTEKPRQNFRRSLEGKKKKMDLEKTNKEEDEKEKKRKTG